MSGDGGFGINVNRASEFFGDGLEGDAFTIEFVVSALKVIHGYSKGYKFLLER